MNANTLAEWLKTKMKQGNCSQRQVAKATGISTGSMSAIVHGHVPSPDIIKSLARYFGDDPDTVLEIAGIVKLSDMPREATATERDILRRLRRLEPHEQTVIVSQIDGLLRFFEDQDSQSESE
jgi:transcriptional regulator with XRE-family HTH domain